MIDWALIVFVTLTDIRRKEGGKKRGWTIEIAVLSANWFNKYKYLTMWNRSWRRFCAYRLVEYTEKKVTKLFWEVKPYHGEREWSLPWMHSDFRSYWESVAERIEIAMYNFTNIQYTRPDHIVTRYTSPDICMYVCISIKLYCRTPNAAVTNEMMKIQIWRVTPYLCLFLDIFSLDPSNRIVHDSLIYLSWWDNYYGVLAWDNSEIPAR